ncbi:flavin prenyltransferase UbiX [Pleionea litopenaei]|uniref:Flavin prenyltransferase UbiX n=1 Tax=Pleionea litopenaei TaxID=3070815 RepID=A0AA51X869_9GAMM|nr:flavin prenyltransferase UbiX [Pleionea sp. HL-JVS1]WMS88631.1 flavin prenyltransferase UbiX [Pleionea sp. HL-JVS1]
MNTQTMREHITVGITGASGAGYAVALLHALKHQYRRIYVILSDAARVVFATEIDWAVPENSAKASEFFERKISGEGEIILCSKMNWMSPVASGSAAPKQMIICPCSTGTLSAIATGASDNLLERAADVVLKERGQLILMVRETPLSAIHLENMLKLSQTGATIMPLAPGFYHKPQNIDDLFNFMVGRVLDHLEIEQSVMPRWGYKHKDG